MYVHDNAHTHIRARTRAHTHIKHASTRSSCDLQQSGAVFTYTDAQSATVLYSVLSKAGWVSLCLHVIAFGGLLVHVPVYMYALSL